MRLEVRCCCLPQKVFGTLEVPDDIARNGGTFRIPYMERPFAEFHDNWDKEPSQFGTYTIEVRPFVIDSFIRKMAVYSDDRPIEFWRELPGFVEA